MKTYFFWDKNLAKKIAYNQSIIMKKIHWIIVFYFRSFFFKYKSIPNTRLILNYLNLKYSNVYDSIFLFCLFPNGVINQVSKISLLPNNVICF